MITNTNIRNNFVNILWDPLQALINLPNDPNSTDYFSGVLSSNPSIAHKMRGFLNSYNAAVIAPTITALSVTTGPIAGGTLVTITGINFIEAFTNRLGGRTARMIVNFGSMPITAITVIDQNTIEVTTPAQVAGVVAVGVELQLTSSFLLTRSTTINYTYA